MNGLLTYISVPSFTCDVELTNARDIEVYRDSGGIYNVDLKHGVYFTTEYDEFMEIVRYIDKTKNIHIMDKFFNDYSYCGTF